MATVKIVLRKKQNKEGEYPIALRITKDRKSSFIYTGHYVRLEDWNEKEQRVRKSHPNSARLNNFLLKKLAEANNTSIELETNQTVVSSVVVKQKLKPSAGASFFAQAEEYLKELKATGKHNQYSATKPRINRFREFMKGADISFPEITPALLERFKTHLKTTRKRTHKKTDTIRPITDRTVINHLVTIRSIFGHAVRHGITERRFSPFGADKIVIRFPDSLKIGLTREEVKTLEEMVLTVPAINHARNIWLFSFYFAGMRVSDVLRLKWSDFQNDRLYYAMGKNDKGASLKLSPQVQAILDQYRRDNPKHDLVFPELEVLPHLHDDFETQKRISLSDRNINESLAKVAELAGLNKPLTMHIARHTFGNLSGDKIPIQMLQKLYRHSSVTTTIGYQSNFINQAADDALEAVING